jgi:TIR domain
MKIFISYRRDDTAGRAGRLFDQLVARFGARNVFQDVAAIAPGSDFPQQVADAIAQSDATLVVIGSDWLDMRGPDGVRRLDEPDDYVRREVGAALAAGVRVVPVLVDRAELPTADDLPEDLRPLATRQAVALRDATWHLDVDGLVSRLHGEELVEPRRRLWRRWPVVAGAVVALLAAGLGGWILLSDDDTGGADSSDGALTGCPTPDSSWPNVDVPDGALAVVRSDGFTYTYTVQDFYYQLRAPDPTEIVVRVELENQTTGKPDTADGRIYYSDANFDTLFVDRVSQGKPVCFSVVSGGVNIDPGTRAIALVGFASTEDPTDAPLSLRTNGGVEIPITTES